MNEQTLYQQCKQLKRDAINVVYEALKPVLIFICELIKAMVE